MSILLKGIDYFILKPIEWLTKLTAFLAALSLVLIALLISTEVASRALFGSSIGISWEFSAYLMAMLFFFGSAYTLRTEGHVRVSLLLQTLPPRGARLLDLAVTLLACVISVFLATALFDLASTSLAHDNRSLTPSRTPLAIPQFLVAAGALSMSLAFIARFLKVWLFSAALKDQVPANAHEQEQATLANAQGEL